MDLFEGLEVLRIGLVIVGTLYLLAGIWFHFLFIQLNGFVIGGILGALIGPLLFDDYELLMSIIGFITLGVIGAGLAVFLDLLGVFFSGLILGAIGGGLGYYIAFDSDPSVGIFLFFGIIGGVLMLTLYRTWLIGLTSFIGAVYLGLGLNIHPGWWLLFFLIGIGVQSSLYKTPDPDSKATITIPWKKDSLTSQNNTQETIRSPQPYVNSLPSKSHSPLDLAKLRLSKGEITVEEFKIIEDRLSD